MRNVVHRVLVSLVIVLLLGMAASLLGGCDEAVDRLSVVLYPTDTPGITTVPTEPLPTTQPPTSVPSPRVVATTAPTLTQLPTVAPTEEPVATATPALVVATAEPTETLEPTEEPTPQERPLPALGLLYAQAGSIFRGDPFGDAALEVARVPDLEAWALRQGVLALNYGPEMAVIDLTVGSYEAFTVGRVEQAEMIEVFWGATGRAVLQVALVVDEEATTFKRSALLRALSAEDGQVVGQARVADVSNASVLFYDDSQNRVALVPRGAEPTFSEIEYYDLTRGELVGAFPLEGEGDLVMSPDGSQVITQRFTPEGAELLLYDLARGGEPQVWPHPQSSHSVSHVWSPNGDQVAYLLHEGATYGTASSRALGVWVLNLGSMEAFKILEEPAGSSSVSAWMPGGEYIAGYHRGEGEDRYHYLVRPDGGDRRILALPAQAQILGWMPMAAELAAVPMVVIDPWTVRFSDASGDTGETVELVAELLAHRDAGSIDLSLDSLRGYLRRAGWEVDAVRPNLWAVSEDTLLLQLPPATIYLVEPRYSETIANGDLIIDARRVGDELGLIYGMTGPSSVQPNYKLYRRQDDGTWSVVWAPQGQRTWITTDGDIHFAGEGLGAITVSGTSFGLETSEDRLFVECRECPHRQLSALWAREDDGYVLQTDLDEDATLEDIVQEMTQSTPYGIFYETVWRLREGLQVDSLVANDGVVVKMRDFGFLDDQVLLAPEQESVDGIYLTKVGEPTRYYARVVNGRVQYVGPATE